MNMTLGFGILDVLFLVFARYALFLIHCTFFYAICVGQWVGGTSLLAVSGFLFRRFSFSRPISQHLTVREEAHRTLVEPVCSPRSTTVGSVLNTIIFV
jgi:hypothetical protein